MKKSKLIAMLMAVVMLFGLTACGGGSGEDPIAPVSLEEKYSDIISMLEREQYDSALSYIREMRDKAQMEANKDNVDAAAKDLVAEFAGEYVLNCVSAYETTTLRTILINADMTLTIEGVTYPMSIVTEKGDTEPHIEYQVVNADGSESKKYLYPSVTEAGLHTIMIYENYFRKDEMESLAKKELETIAGEYQSYRDETLITIQNDFTAVIDGTTYPIEYTYDTYGKRIRFYAMGYSRYDGGGDTYTELDVRYDDKGFASLWFDYNRNDQLEFVEITAENFYDYFEFRDWELDSTDENAFGEIADMRIVHYIALKPEYTEKYYSLRSKVAAEISTTSVSYGNSEITVDIASREVSIQFGKADYRYDPSSQIYSGVYKKEHYDDVLNDYVTDLYYLFYDSEYINMDKLIAQDGDRYTFNTYVYSMEDIEILRCQMKLAFKKLNL